MVEVRINNKVQEVPKHFTILQACEEVGIQIPRFCYHERLSIAGNCRMCLVELKNSVKPVASCAMNVSEGMEIWTNTLLVKKAREGVMEFLLCNHPLDCPICDQGGECDLQDQAMLFGNDRGRFYEAKRSVSNKDCGPFIKTIMTRCIHCTRCVRFSTELGGLQELGTTGRGGATEIGNYVSKAIRSEVSGNIIDLCPVGALTAKPYAFQARSWELKRTETVDTLDSMGSNISVHTSGKKIMRILPALNEDVNEEWLNDRTRFNYGGFVSQRLSKPFGKEGSQLLKSNWESTLKGNLASYNLSLGRRHAFTLGQSASLEAVGAFKKLKCMFGWNLVTEDSNGLSNDFRQDFSFNTGYSGLTEGDVCLLVGVNLQSEMPLLAMRLRKEQRERGLPVICVGATDITGLKTENVGSSLFEFVKLLEGRHRACSLFATKQKPIVILGSGEASALFKQAMLSTGSYNPFQGDSGWNGVNILLKGTSACSNLELNASDRSMEPASAGYWSAVNTFGTGLQTKSGKALTYFGSHGSKVASNFKRLVPLLTNFEQDGSFLNNEGRLQFGKFLFSGPTEARTLEGTLLAHLHFMKKKDDSKVSFFNENLLLANKESYKTFYVGEAVSLSVVKERLFASASVNIFRDDYISVNSRSMVEADKSYFSTSCVNFS